MRVASRQASRPPLIWLKVRRMLKRTSGLHKFVSIMHRMGMKLESKAFDSLRIKAETLKRIQSVRDVNDTPYTQQENDMKYVVSCYAAPKGTVLSLSSLELPLRASVLTVLDLNEMDGVMLPIEFLRASLSGLVSCG